MCIRDSIHDLLDESKKRQFDAAWNAYIEAHPEVMNQLSEIQYRDSLTEQGNYDAAVEAAEALQMYK